MRSNQQGEIQADKVRVPSQQFQLQLFEATNEIFTLNSLEETTTHLNITFAEYLTNAKQNGISRDEVYVEYIRHSDIVKFIAQAYTLFRDSQIKGSDQ